MKLSKCYQATNGKLSCLTCHDPHEQPDPMRAPVYFRAKCLGCHGEASCKLSLRSRRKKTVVDDCIGCHMPKRDLEKISHSALTNHRIPVRQGAGFSVPNSAPSSDLPGLVLLTSISFH